MCCKCWRQKCKNWEHLLVHCYHSEVWWVISCCSISALLFCDHLCDHLLIVSTVRQYLYPKQSLCLTLLLPLGKVAKHIRLLQQLERWATAYIPVYLYYEIPSLDSSLHRPYLVPRRTCQTTFFLWMFCQCIPGAVVWAAQASIESYNH